MRGRKITGEYDDDDDVRRFTAGQMICHVYHHTFHTMHCVCKKAVPIHSSMKMSHATHMQCLWSSSEKASC